jgi:ATP-dependent RNA helicase RhlE
VDEEIFLRDIEKLIKRSIPREAVPGFEPPRARRPSPSCWAA